MTCFIAVSAFVKASILDLDLVAYIPELILLDVYKRQGLGVLLGSLVDHRGNMFYAPAFSALVGGGIYQVFVEKIQRTGAILVVALVIGAFFLFTRHGAGAFLPALVGGLLAELVASRGHYQSKLGNAVSFLLFSFTTTGPILMMWFQPASYRASLLARGKSMDCLLYTSCG